MSSSNLALKYRPRIFEAVVGQKSVQVVLRQMVLKNDVPTAVTFSGPRGTGKTSTARILAAALNCEMRPGPCGSCPSCEAVMKGNSVDVIEVDAGSNGNVDDVRSLRDLVQYSVGGNYRVILLDEAHSMSRPGFDALLKVLEEPPPNTVFVLLTTEIGKIPETIMSRCMDFRFGRIPTAEIVGRLRYVCEQERLEAEEAFLQLLAERADGGMRDALMSLDQYTRVGLRTAEALAEHLGESDFSPPLLAALAANDLPKGLSITEDQMMRGAGDAKWVCTALISTLKDLLVIQGGGIPTKQGVALEVRQRLAATVESPRLLSLCQLIWDFKTKIRVDEQRSMIDMLVVMMHGVLIKGRAPSQPAANGNGNGQGKLSLNELRAMQPIK